MHLPEDVELVAIINSFNRRPLLEKAIGSLAPALRAGSAKGAMVVFEAGSRDGSREFLEQWRTANPQDQLIIVSSADANSFSAGVNAAVAEALIRFPRCRGLFLFETDNWLGSAEPIKQAKALLEAEPQLAATGFTVRRHDGRRCAYGMRFPTARSLALGLNLVSLWNLEAPNESSWQVRDGVHWRTCDVVFTSPLLIRRAAWEQVGSFDAEAFPFSDSDLDWAWRCADAGWKTAVIETDQVVHDNLAQASEWSANRVVHFHRARLRLLKRHGGRGVALVKPLLFLRHCAEAFALLWKSRREGGAREKLSRRREMIRTVWNDYE